jgi:hypothetical protein
MKELTAIHSEKRFDLTTTVKIMKAMRVMHKRTVPMAFSFSIKHL